MSGKKIDKKIIFEKCLNKFGDICLKENFEKEYFINGLSIPDFKKKYYFNQHYFYFLIDYHGFKKRNMSEATKLCVNKRIKTCQEKYGCDNPSQSLIIKEKKRQTFLENYGVDNIFKTDNFCNSINENFIKKYNMTRKEYISFKSKEIWNKCSKEEKRLWLIKSILSGKISKLEKKIKKILKKLKIEFIDQFSLGKFVFDFKIGNILLEVNGDFWHANPEIYKSDDILNYPGNNKIMAKEIWKRDKLKQIYAIENNYEIKYIWESYINNIEENEMEFFLMEMFKNV